MKTLCVGVLFGIRSRKKPKNRCYSLDQASLPLRNPIKENSDQKKQRLDHFDHSYFGHENC
ncbi:hypothetical protein Hanom_Chr15g01353611 [Helianthus anomalus]